MRSSAVSRRGGAGAGIVSLAARAIAVFEADRGASAAPHSEQKFWPGAVTEPHSGHEVASDDPHSVQNFAPDTLSVPQRGQTVAAPLTSNAECKA